MQKVFINKETNMVEQILREEEGEEIREDYFSNCYMVEDPDDKVNGYNLKHNKQTEKFEVVEGLPAFAEVEVINQPTPEDYNTLKKENEELKDRLDNIENMIKQTLAKE